MKKKKNKLHNMRLDILKIAIKHDLFDGWNHEIIDSIASKSKFKSEEIAILFPKGYKSILEFYLSDLNDNMFGTYQKINLTKMKTHERVREIILLILKNNKKNKKLIRKTFFSLILPQHYKIATAALYDVVDKIWFIAGDNSTDFNFYTKRAILALIYSSTVFYWLNNNKNLEQTKIFLNKQLKKISTITKIKKNLKVFNNFLPHAFSLSKEFKR